MYRRSAFPYDPGLLHTGQETATADKINCSSSLSVTVPLKTPTEWTKEAWGIRELTSLLLTQILRTAYKE